MDAHPRLFVSKSTATPHLMTRIRDRETPRAAFRSAARRLMGILVEEALANLPSVREVTVDTPTGTPCPGTVVDEDAVVAVSIMRAGDSMVDAVTTCIPSCPIGKILVQRNEETAQPQLMYSKMPDLTGCQVLLLDPMLATGGSAKSAIGVLLSKGAREEDITFVNVVACPEGIRSVFEAHPAITLVTGAVDEGLNDRSYIIPGLGDFGDRYFA
mmetsp:Transcript_4714/g.15780  ORF Transcript_4714/g.15780 Transcript_4714/m.15780 type:complete len:214 (+) Transcript_4714:160-801(+)